MTTQKDYNALKEAFDNACQSISELQDTLEPYKKFRQFIPKPLNKLSASEKLRIARDIIQLKEDEWDN